MRFDRFQILILEIYIFSQINVLNLVRRRGRRVTPFTFIGVNYLVKVESFDWGEK